jgi:putative phage-type endonuclease
MTEHVTYPDSPEDTAAYQQAADSLTLAANELPVVMDRSTYVGGGDIAAVMGLSPWKTPVELWQQKTHKVAEDVSPEKVRIFRRGARLEPFIRDMTIEKLQDMGLQAELVHFNRRYVDPQVPFFAAEIDFELVVSGVVEINGEEVVFDSEHINCDAKSVTGFARKKWGDVGSDEIPIEYAAQFMWGLGITNRKYCLVAALRSFDDVDLFWVKADVETVLAMRAKASTFWLEHVLKDVPPDPVNFADLKLLFAKADPVADFASTDDEALVQKVYNYKRTTAAIKDLEAQAETLKFEIGAAIGDKPGLAHNGKPLVTWGNEKETRFKAKDFAAAHPELAEEWTHRGTHRVMRVKVK